MTPKSNDDFETDSSAPASSDAVPGEHDDRINPVVNEISSMLLLGPTIHHSWSRNLRLYDGSADLHAVFVLAYVVYKYVLVYNERTGEMKPKFSGTWLEVLRRKLAERIGLDEESLESALLRLEHHGLIQNTRRENSMLGVWLRIIPVPSMIASICTSTGHDNVLTAPADLGAAKRPSEAALPPPTAASAAPILGVLDSNLLADTEEFVRLWNAARDAYGVPGRINERDKRAIRRLLKDDKSTHVETFVKVAINAWVTADRMVQVPGRFDTFFNCRRADDAEFFCQRFTKIVRELQWGRKPEQKRAIAVWQEMQTTASSSNTSADVKPE